MGFALTIGCAMVTHMLPWWLGVAGLTLGAITIFVSLRLAKR